MSDPKGLITPAEAKALSDAYTSRCELISRDITKRDDNRSTWFSLDEIRNYLDYAEKQARDLGKVMNGIRVYCGAYPDDGGQVGYSTSFIVPTTSGSSEEGNDGDGGNPDLEGGDGLNKGSSGIPPGIGYPQ